MSQCTNSNFLTRCLHQFVIVLLLLGSLSLISGSNLQAAKAKAPSDLLQFTAADHILGFETEGMYIASGDHMLRINFAGASGIAPMADDVASNDGRTQQLSRIIYANLWPGVTLRYDRVTEGIVQSNYLLQPGADVNQIQLCYNAPVAIEAGGSLRIKYETGQIRESAPVAWQDINGRRIPVEVAFCLLDSSICNPAVGFALGQYDSAYPLIIDPTLEWNTFIGSSDFEWSSALAVDASGNVYVVGYGYASWGSPLIAHEGGNDAFAAKLNSSGVRQWHTFLGSSGYDTGSDIAVDGSGNVYVVGAIAKPPGERR